MVQCALALAARRNKNIAVVALARKLVGIILWMMWRDGNRSSQLHRCTATEDSNGLS